MNEKVIMVGAGGHALSISEFAREYIAGYTANEANHAMCGEWAGTDEQASELVKQGYLFHMAFIYHGLPTMGKRAALINYYRSIGAKFLSLISPHSIVTPNSKIGDGCAVMSGAIINRATIEENGVVNSGAIVEHDCIVGENSFIGPGAVIGGFTSIGKNCFIGLGARIGNGLTIADNISVAMGAVVNKNLTEPGIYHGFPLKCFNRNKLK